LKFIIGNGDIMARKLQLSAIVGRELGVPLASGQGCRMAPGIIHKRKLHHDILVRL
jgi:hypothetical protein